MKMLSEKTSHILLIAGGIWLAADIVSPFIGGQVQSAVTTIDGLNPLPIPGWAILGGIGAFGKWGIKGAAGIAVVWLAANVALKSVTAKAATKRMTLAIFGVLGFIGLGWWMLSQGETASPGAAIGGTGNETQATLPADNVDVPNWTLPVHMAITNDPATWPQGDRIWNIARAIAYAEGANVCWIVPQTGTIILVTSQTERLLTDLILLSQILESRVSPTKIPAGSGSTRKSKTPTPATAKSTGRT